MNTNKTEYFGEIARLSALLTMHGVAHTLVELHDGYQLRPVEGEWDVVSREFTGSGLEGYLGNFVHDVMVEEEDGEEYPYPEQVMQHLTAEEALAVILGE